MVQVISQDSAAIGFRGMELSWLVCRSDPIETNQQDGVVSVSYDVACWTDRGFGVKHL